MELEWIQHRSKLELKFWMMELSSMEHRSDVELKFWMMELSSLELRSNLELEFWRMELDYFWNLMTFGTREFLELESFWNLRVFGTWQLLELESFWNLTTFGTREFLELESFWNLRVFGTWQLLELDVFWNSDSKSSNRKSECVYEILEFMNLDKQPGSSSRDDNCGQRSAFRRWRQHSNPQPIDSHVPALRIQKKCSVGTRLLIIASNQQRKNISQNSTLDVASVWEFINTKI